MPEHRERAEYTAKHEEKASTLLFPTVCTLDWMSMPGTPQYENLFFHGNTNAPWTFYTPHTAQSQQTKQSPHQGAARQNLSERNPLKQKQQQQQKSSHFDLLRRCLHPRCHALQMPKQSFICPNQTLPRQSGKTEHPVHSPSYKAVPTKEHLWQI